MKVSSLVWVSCAVVVAASSSSCKSRRELDASESKNGFVKVGEELVYFYQDHNANDPEFAVCVVSCPNLLVSLEDTKANAAPFTPNLDQTDPTLQYCRSAVSDRDQNNINVDQRRGCGEIAIDKRSPKETVARAHCVDLSQAKTHFDKIIRNSIYREAYTSRMEALQKVLSEPTIQVDPNNTVWKAITDQDLKLVEFYAALKNDPEGHCRPFDRKKEFDATTRLKEALRRLRAAANTDANAARAIVARQAQQGDLAQMQTRLAQLEGEVEQRSKEGDAQRKELSTVLGSIREQVNTLASLGVALGTDDAAALLEAESALNAKRPSDIAIQHGTRPFPIQAGRYTSPNHTQRDCVIDLTFDAKKKPKMITTVGHCIPRVDEWVPLDESYDLIGVNQDGARRVVVARIAAIDDVLAPGVGGQNYKYPRFLYVNYIDSTFGEFWWRGPIPGDEAVAPEPAPAVTPPKAKTPTPKPAAPETVDAQPMQDQCYCALTNLGYCGVLRNGAFLHGNEGYHKPADGQPCSAEFCRVNNADLVNRVCGGSVKRHPTYNR
jgi:hypothetical protein